MPIDLSAAIAPSALVHPEATIGPRCSIGAFCVIDRDVAVGADCVLEPYVHIKRWTTLGHRNQVSAGTVLGTDPLDKNFRAADRSYLRIGSGNVIREHYTISRGTQPESVTTIGDGNYIMTGGHIAHNATVGNETVIASCALVAGHVEIEDGAFLSGGVVVHQYSKIGRLAMIGGNTRVNLDAPPYFLYSGFNIQPIGLNLVGLKRAGLSFPEIAGLKSAFKLIYRKGLRLEDALLQIERDLPGEHTTHLVGFIRRSKRGICRP